MNYIQCRPKDRVVAARCPRVMQFEEKSCKGSTQCRVRFVDKSSSRSNLLSSLRGYLLAIFPLPNSSRTLLVADIPSPAVRCVA